MNSKADLLLLVSSNIVDSSSKIFNTEEDKDD